MTTTLVTGATRGLGRETARRLVEAGHTVYLGSRDAARGEEAAAAIGAAALTRRPPRREHAAARTADPPAAGGSGALTG